MRKSGLLLLAFLLACGEDGHDDLAEIWNKQAAEPPPPVAEGLLRVRHLQPIPIVDAIDRNGLEAHRWAFDWLESEGWRFSGWEFESGSGGEVAIRWHDPRRPSREFASLRFRLPAGKRASVYLGVQGRQLRAGPVDLECPNCRRRFQLSGSITSGSIECRQCGTNIPTDPEWDAAPTREFRIALVGAARNVRGGRELKSVGPVLRAGGGPDFLLYVGALPRNSVMPQDANAVDPVLIQSGGSADYGAGKSVFSCRYRMPGNLSFRQSTSSTNRELRFTMSFGEITIAGNRSDYTVSVAGKPVAIEDYPLAVWEFELDWQPFGNAR